MHLKIVVETFDMHSVFSTHIVCRNFAISFFDTKKKPKLY